MSTAYQPKTGSKCNCRPGVQRDNCSACEGTGWQIDFKAIRERRGVQPDPAVAALVSAAADARDRFGDDELERFADELRAKEKENTP